MSQQQFPPERANTYDSMFSSLTSMPGSLMPSCLTAALLGQQPFHASQRGGLPLLRWPSHAPNSVQIGVPILRRKSYVGSQISVGRNPTWALETGF